MFIGHFGVGLGAKKPAPRVSLGTLFLAAQFLDLLWPTFVLLGWEHVSIEPGNTVLTPLDFSYFPFSHSLAMALVWSVLFGTCILYNSNAITNLPLLLALCVVSHWVLDLVSTSTRSSVFPGNSPKVGFALVELPVN